MSSRANDTLRVFGRLHIAMALLAFVLVAVRMARVPRDLRSAPNASQFVAFLVADTATSLLCLVLLGTAGAALLRSDPRGVRRTKVVLLLAFIWALGVSAADSNLFHAGGRWRSLAVSHVIARGTGWVPRPFLVLTAYPLIALIAINRANRRRRRFEDDRFSPARQADALPLPGAAMTSPGELAMGGRRKETGSWARRILRVFGVLHIIMAVMGVMGAIGHAGDLPKELALHPAPPHFLTFYFAVTAVSLPCLYLLGTAGVALVRRDPRGVRRSNLALLLEVVWFTGASLPGEVMRLAGGPWGPLGMSEIRATDEGTLCLIPQVVTGYALVALIAVNLANRRLRRISG